MGDARTLLDLAATVVCLYSFPGFFVGMDQLSFLLIESPRLIIYLDTFVRSGGDLILSYLISSYLMDLHGSGLAHIFPSQDVP